MVFSGFGNKYDVGILLGGEVPRVEDRIDNIGDFYYGFFREEFEGFIGYLIGTGCFLRI